MAIVLAEPKFRSAKESVGYAVAELASPKVPAAITSGNPG